MDNYSKKYWRWREEILPSDLEKELRAIEENEDEIYDRFFREIAFGTSGMRGKMGAGDNRINSITLKRATIGMGTYLLENHKGGSLAIGYDTRINSKEYAHGVAEVLENMGLEVYLFSIPTPVPLLSFSIRNLKLNGGIMITASHNPKEYNGYKVYDHVGNQIDEEKARLLEHYIKKVDPFQKIERKAGGRVRPMPKVVLARYHRALAENTPYWKEKDLAKSVLQRLKICYTPLNGAGRDFVTTALKELGIKEKNLIHVESQWEADGSFPTCPSPNPEYERTFLEAIERAESYSAEGVLPHIIIATDPDCDRMGLAVLHNGEYVHLNGNQVGTLMFDYLCRCREDGDKRGIAFKSYVTTPLVEEIGKSYGVEVRNTFTGFKNIVLEIEKLEQEGRGEEFLFAFEESIGYMYGNYTRDKDGVMGAILACLMTAEMMEMGKTLVDRMEEISQRYGYLESITSAIYYKEEKDRKKMEYIMKRIFEGLFADNVTRYHLATETCYEKQNMYIADFEGGDRLIVRPSGTELKLKIYIFSRGKTFDEAIDKAAELSAMIRNVIIKEQTNG